MRCLLPQVYSVEIPLSSRIRLELLRSHKFFRVLAPAQSEAERRQKVLHSLHILTTETMFLFTIALFYDVDVRSCIIPSFPVMFCALSYSAACCCLAFHRALATTAAACFTMTRLPVSPGWRSPTAASLIASGRSNHPRRRGRRACTPPQNFRGRYESYFCTSAYFYEF